MIDEEIQSFLAGSAVERLKPHRVMQEETAQKVFHRQTGRTEPAP
jgi:hypothetical protein